METVNQARPGLKYKEKIQFSETVYKHLEKHPMFMMSALKRAANYPEGSLVEVLSGRNSFHSIVASEVSRDLLSNISSLPLVHQEFLKALLTPLADKKVPEAILKENTKSARIDIAAAEPAPGRSSSPPPVKRAKVVVLQQAPQAAPQAKVPQTVALCSAFAAPSRADSVTKSMDWARPETPSACDDDGFKTVTSTARSTRRSKMIVVETKGRPKVCAAEKLEILDLLKIHPSLADVLKVSREVTKNGERCYKVLPHKKDSGCRMCHFLFIHGCKNVDDSMKYRRAVAELHELMIQRLDKCRGPMSASDHESGLTYAE
jgi:hypothetical protein